MKNIRVLYLKIFSFLEVKFSIYLNRRVFVMIWSLNDHLSRCSNKGQAQFHWIYVLKFSDANQQYV